MPNFEQFPPPPSPAPERTPEQEKLAESARKIVGELNGFLSRWRKAHALAAMFGAALAPSRFAESMERPEIRMDAKELQELDPEAGPENVRLILETLPQGFIEGDVAAIEFVDETLSMPEAYGMHGEGAAYATEGVGEGGIRIVYFKGSKEGSSAQIWGDTLLHEVAHANDWVREGGMTEVERSGFRKEIEARVLAEDRYVSSYVESIRNPDPARELELKAVEYWAEITEAYLQGEALPAADEALVAKRIAASDPGFDRDAALLKRHAVIDRMSYQEALHAFDGVPPEDREAALAWVEAREGKTELKELEAARQRQGRRELMKLLRAEAATDERKTLIETQFDFFHAREDLLEARKDRDPKNSAADVAAMKRLASSIEALRRARELADDGTLEVMAGIDAIMEEHDLVLGDHRGVGLTPDEERELFPRGVVDLEDEWFVDMTDWNVAGPEYDTSGIGVLIWHMNIEDDERKGMTDPGPVPGGIRREDE